MGISASDCPLNSVYFDIITQFILSEFQGCQIGANIGQKLNFMDNELILTETCS
jgi:hypothetical protein